MDFYLSEKFGLDWQKHSFKRINGFILIMSQQQEKEEEDKDKAELEAKKKAFFQRIKHGS